MMLAEVHIQIGAVEGFWIITVSLATVLSALALLDAIRDRAAIAQMNGQARRLIGVGNIRRETGRLVINIALFSLEVPAMFDDADIQLTPFLVVLLAVPVVILANSALDWWERRRLSAILATEIEAERAGVARRRSTDHG